MRLSGWHLPVNQVSASALTLAMQCPEQYRMKHIKKHKDKMFSDRLMGIADHEVFEDNMRLKLATGQILPFEEQQKRYVHYWKHEIEKNGEPVWKGKPDDLIETGFKMLRAYQPYLAKILPVKVEERFEVEIKGLPVPLVGYIDLQEADAILERKTSKTKLSKPKPAWGFQGRIYQLEADLPVKWHIITKQVTPQIVTPEEAPALMLPRMNKDVTVAMILQAATTLNDYYARYGPDNPWPMTGRFHDWLCAYCAFGPENGGTCPSWAVS